MEKIDEKDEDAQNHDDGDCDMKDADCEMFLDGNKNVEGETNCEEIVGAEGSIHNKESAQHKVEGKPRNTGGTSGEAPAGKTPRVMVVDVPGEPTGGTPADRRSSRASLGLEAAVTEPENKYASSFNIC